MLIDEPERAQRLARALCTDVRLYNTSSLSEAAPAERARLLGAPVFEAYELYVSRVTEPQRHWFEEAAAELYAELGVPFDGIRKPPPARIEQAPAGPPAVHPPVPGRERERDATGSGGSPPLALAVAIAVIVLLLGVVGFLLSSR